MNEKEQNRVLEPAKSAEVKAPVIAKTRSNDTCPSGFFCYIGPDLTRLLRKGTAFLGTRTQALEAAAKAIEKFPLVKTLIVPGDDLPAARLKVKTPGNALYQNYKRLASQQMQK